MDISSSSNNKRLIFLFVIFLIILIISFPFLFFHILFLLFLSYLIFRASVHKKMMKSFSISNGFEYKDYLPIDSLKGSIFNFGSSRKITNGMIGEYNNRDINIFNYETTTGSGKNKQTYLFTVFEIFFDQIEFPSILLRFKKKWIDGLQIIFEKDLRKINLEKEFKDSFDLFCKDDYEIETFQIFTPEVLNFIKSKKIRFNIKMIEDKVYIYDQKLILEEDQLYELYSVAQFIIDSLGPLLERLKGDFDSMHNYYKE